jgi:hypothetical protein
LTAGIESAFSMNALVCVPDSGVVKDAEKVLDMFGNVDAVKVVFDGTIAVGNANDAVEFVDDDIGFIGSKFETDAKELGCKARVNCGCCCCCGNVD